MPARVRSRRAGAWPRGFRIASAGLVVAGLVLCAGRGHALGLCVGGSQGVTIPVASGEEGGNWRMGPHWQVEGGLCIPFEGMVLAVGLAIEVAQASVGDVTVTSVEVGPMVSVLFKIAPVLFGVGLTTGLAFSDDPRPGRQIAVIAPDRAGAANDAQVTIPLDLGAVLWWPLRRWATLVVAVDVDLHFVRHDKEIAEGVFVYGGPPPVSVVPRLGVLFAF